MGRAGGYGRTGHFADHMVVKRRYNKEMVQAFFKAEDDAITLLQAKAVLDSIARSKHYPAERVAGTTDVILYHRPRQSTGEASAIPCDLIASHLTSLTIHKEWSKMTAHTIRNFKRRDPLVPQLAGAKVNKQPIEIEGKPYKLVGHSDEPSSRVKLMFQALTSQEVAEFKGDVILLP